MPRAFLQPPPNPWTCAPGKRHVCPLQVPRSSRPNACKAVCRSKQYRCPAAPPVPPSPLLASRPVNFRCKIFRSFRMWNWKLLRSRHPDASSGRANGECEQCCPRRRSRSAVSDCFCALVYVRYRSCRIDWLWCELNLTAPETCTFNRGGAPLKR